MKAHLIDTHLLVPRSRSSAKVKVKYQGNVSQKMGVSGALVFHKHILFSSSNALTLYHTILTFNDPEEEVFVGKGENASNQHFLFFPQCFLLHHREKSSF